MSFVAFSVRRCRVLSATLSRSQCDIVAFSVRHHRVLSVIKTEIQSAKIHTRKTIRKGLREKNLEILTSPPAPLQHGEGVRG